MCLAVVVVSDQNFDMAIFLVSCSLRTTDHNYAPLWEAFEKAHGVRALDSTWLVDVDQSLSDVNRSVLTHLAPDDSALIIEIGPDTKWAATHLRTEAGDWLKDRRG